MRSMETIRGVTSEGLNEYNPEAFDAVAQPDGTFDLVPVRWMNEGEYNEYHFGCGSDGWGDGDGRRAGADTDTAMEDEARRDADLLASIEDRGDAI